MAGGGYFGHGFCRSILCFVIDVLGWPWLAHDFFRFSCVLSICSRPAGMPELRPGRLERCVRSSNHVAPTPVCRRESGVSIEKVGCVFAGWGLIRGRLGPYSAVQAMSNHERSVWCGSGGDGKGTRRIRPGAGAVLRRGWDSACKPRQCWILRWRLVATDRGIARGTQEL